VPARDLRESVPWIRRSRLDPRRTDHLYLHLRRLRDDLRTQIDSLEVTDVLDVFCGARPYEPLFPAGTHYVGLDIDDAYGCADVVSTTFLPFPDSSFDLCLCTQAFYFVTDPAHAVRELARVLRPGGQVVLTLPVAYPETERLYTPLQVRELFAGWGEITVVDSGGTFASIVTLFAYLLHQVEKKTPRRAAKAFAASYVVVNAIGEIVDLAERKLRPNATVFPPSFLFRATRPAPSQPTRP
jgi:SAM-dependent methyltransferase